MNIISRKAYNTIMVKRLEGTGKNLVAAVKDVYVFVGSFTYITDFVVLEDIGEFIMSDMAEVLMGRPFRRSTKLFNTYTYRMPHKIPRPKNFNWSKVPPLLELSQNDLINGLRRPHEKNKFMYKNCLNLGLEYQGDESMKEWLIQGHVSIHEVMQEKGLEIGKCNGRLNPRTKQSEPTFHVFLDALALTLCYSAFLTTTDVPEVYMHHFWDSIHKYDTSYRFRMDKKKKFDLNLEIFRDIFQICPRVHG
ncbi:hypothetical protein Tco_1179121 [Tanacetum coccineum]